MLRDRRAAYDYLVRKLTSEEKVGEIEKLGDRPGKNINPGKPFHEFRMDGGMSYFVNDNYTVALEASLPAWQVGA